MWLMEDERMKDVSKQTTYLSRRDFLKLASVSAAGGILTACSAGAPAPPPTQPAAQEAEATTAPVEEAEATTAPAEEAEEASAPAPAEGAVEMMMNSGELSDEEVKTFNADNPGITLTRIDPDNTRYFAMLTAGNPPGVFRLQAPQFPQLLARNIPLNLQSFIEVSPSLSVEDMTPANNYYRSSGDALAIGDGDVYGMVKDWSPDLTVWANLDLIEAAGLEAPSFTEPLSYEDIRIYAEKLAKFEG